jgi:hypothetical protein
LSWRQDAQARDTFEVAPVARRDPEAVRQSRGGDPEIVQTDEIAGSGKSSPEFRVHSRHGSGDRDRLGAGEKLLDDSPSMGAARSCRSVDAVQQLADCDDADRPILVTDEVLDRPSSPLVLDEQIRVDQDGQGLSGKPDSRRI